jgi:hypothetical protein
VTESELRQIRLLDWLLDCEPEHPGAMPEFSKFIGNEEDLSATEQARWRDVMRGLRDQGLIDLAESLGGNWGLEVTARGRQVAEARRARRADRASRRGAARDGVLAWLAEQPDHQAQEIEEFLTSPRAYYEGAPLDLADAEEALGYLHRRGLVTGIVAAETPLLGPELTDAGVDCIDHYGGSVSEYLRRNDGAGTSNTLNIGSISGSNLAVGNRDVAQNVQAGVSGRELGDVLQAILEAIPALGLSTDDEADLRDSVRMAGNELAKTDPDKGWAKAVLVKTGGILGKTVETALGPVLGAYLRVLAKEHGIDLGDPQ